MKRYIQSASNSIPASADSEKQIVSKIKKYVNSLLKDFHKISVGYTIDEDEYGYDILIITIDDTDEIAVNLYDPETYGDTDELVEFDEDLQEYLDDEVSERLENL